MPHASPGPLLWTGNYFWTIGGPRGLVKLSKDWKVFGSIYPPAEGVWAMAWDGKYLWCLMRTSEMWDDPKIYKVEILDDSL